MAKLLFNGSIRQITLVDGNGNLKNMFLDTSTQCLIRKIWVKSRIRRRIFALQKNEEFCNGIKVAAEKAVQE